MSANGYLKDSELSPIPGGRLRHDAALAWNAMYVTIAARAHVYIRPGGSLSSYRNYAGQVYLWNNVAHPHDTNWVARPGTSNHGWGLAVDEPNHASYINKYGAPYGWQKRWSDAPGEYWHFKFRTGIFKPPSNPYPTIRKGSHGRAVRRLQVLLRRAGYMPAKWHAHNKYTLFVRRAVRKFQKEHKLTVDGVVGNQTWAAIRKAAK